MPAARVAARREIAAFMGYSIATGWASEASHTNRSGSSSKTISGSSQGSGVDRPSAAPASPGAGPLDPSGSTSVYMPTAKANTAAQAAASAQPNAGGR